MKALRKLATTTSLVVGLGFAASTAYSSTVSVPPIISGTEGTEGTSWFVDFADTFAGVDLEARALWTYVDSIVGATSTVWNFTVNMANTTAVTEDGTNRISSWGFNTTPDSVGDNLTTPEDDWFFASGNVPSGLGSYEVCLKEGGGTNNCGGGGGGGIAENDSVFFEFSIETANADPLVFDDFFVRYQGVGANSEDSTAIPGTPSIVPVPAAGFLLIGALGGLALLRRRKTA